jgi:CRP/FNR family transcriptional regulator, cyclic AMP receptor protein
VAAPPNIGFDPEEFLATAGVGRTQSARGKDEIIFSQGDPADAVFYLQKGRVKLSVTSPQGKEAVVGILKAGEFFGEGSLIGQPVRLATARALEEGSTMRVERATMLRWLKDEPELATMFTARLLAHTSRVEADLVDHLFNSSEKRLARTLLLLANFGKDGKPDPIKLKITQETLAEMVGTTRSRVSFFMNKFRKLGYIDYNGTLRVNGSLVSVLLTGD